MLEAIKQLLVLQDRDRKIIQVKNQLADMAPQRHVMETRTTQSQTNLENVRNQLKQLEAARNESELEVVALRQRIEKYSLQQYQTKKNDEYRALGHEMDRCKAAIVTQEDQQLDLMEKIDAIQKQAAQAAHIAQEDKSLAIAKLAELDVREQNLQKQLLTLQQERERLASTIEESALNRYERMLKNKGDKVLVGIDHGVCAGCHMTLPTQLLILCQSDLDIVVCSNCGRMLYYTSDMDATHAER